MRIAKMIKQFNTTITYTNHWNKGLVHWIIVLMKQTLHSSVFSGCLVLIDFPNCLSNLAEYSLLVWPFWRLSINPMFFCIPQRPPLSLQIKLDLLWTRRRGAYCMHFLFVSGSKWWPQHSCWVWKRSMKTTGSAPNIVRLSGDVMILVRFWLDVSNTHLEKPLSGQFHRAEYSQLYHGIC